MKQTENSVENEEFEQKADALTKEEILAKSREENKNGDEMQKSGAKIAAGIAISVGMVIACLVMVLSLIFDAEVPMAVSIIVFAILSAYFIFLGIKGSKFRKFLLACGILVAICDVILIVLWILELCGVVL